MRWTSFIALILTASFTSLPSADGRGTRNPASVDPVTTNIARLQPRLGVMEQDRLARALRAVASDCQIPWQILLSLAFHESSLNVKAVNDKSKDHGLTQINEKTIESLRLDRQRLLWDEQYALSAACRVLSENRSKYSERYSFWLGMYRSGTAVWKDAVRDNAKRYDRMIRHTASIMGYEELRVATK